MVHFLIGLSAFKPVQLSGLPVQKETQITVSFQIFDTLPVMLKLKTSVRAAHKLSVHVTTVLLSVANEAKGCW